MEWRRNPDGTRIREEGATIEMRFNADERYRRRLEEMGWNEENIPEMDEHVQAIEAFDEQREEDALWAQRFSSSASSAGSEQSKGKGKGVKGGFMGTGWRTQEERVYAGHWKKVRHPGVDPGRARHLNEEQWRLAQQYQHQGVYQLPPEEEGDAHLTDTEEEEEEETVQYQGNWHQGWQGWRWQQQSWWW